MRSCTWNRNRPRTGIYDVINDEEAAKRRQQFCAEIERRAGSYEYYCKVGNNRIFAHTPIGPVIWHRAWCLTIPFPLGKRRRQE